MTKSYCVHCDAEPGDCTHNGNRYLEDIVYEDTIGGWKVPEHERARWDAAPLLVTPKPTVDPTAKDIEDIVLDLAGVVYLDHPLEVRLRTTHAIDPVMVSRLAAATIEGATRGSLTNPGGFLTSRLADIERDKTKAP